MNILSKHLGEKNTIYWGHNQIFERVILKIYDITFTTFSRYYNNKDTVL